MDIHNYSPFPTVKASLTSVRFVLWMLLKTTLFLMISSFILCVPLGDPATQCSVKNLNQKSNMLVPYSSLCNIYSIMSVTTVQAGKMIQNVISLITCVVANACYDIKLKLYSLLEKFDRQDLCNSVCCADIVNRDVSSQSPDGQGKRCKCNLKCCHHKTQKL